VLHVIIVAFRSDALIRRCLAPLLADRGVARVVVVDNSSDPATAAACRELDAGPRLVYLATDNLGYAKACNLGADLMSGDDELLAIVNPDVELHRPLSSLAARTRGHPGSVFSALLEERHGALNARAIADARHELYSAVLGSRAYAGYRLPTSGPGFVQVPQIDGSLLLLPAGEFRALGGFDERFELYFEDVDLCRRANLRQGCHLLPEQWGSHVGGASFAAAGAVPFLVLRASRVRYLRKWYGGRGAALALLVAGLEYLARFATGAAPSRRALATALRIQVIEAVRPGRRRYLTRAAAPERVPR
jgi:N-acetylglucosaminyl-diphospho-decaprenol L-rhamnosyltransferase